MKAKKSIIVACGGTGGHVFPGLAVANELKSREHSVEVWFSGRKIETSTHSGWDGSVFSTGARQISLRNFPGMVNMEKTAKKVAWSSGKELLVTTSTKRNWLVLEQKLLKNVTPERKQPDQQ